MQTLSVCAAHLAACALADLAAVVPPPKFKPIDVAYQLLTGPSVELDPQEFDLTGGVVVASCPAGVWTGSAKYYGHEGGEISYTGVFWRCFPFGQGMARFADGSAHQGLFTSYVLGNAPKLVDAKSVRVAVREGPGNAMDPAGKVVAGLFARGVEADPSDARAQLVPNLIRDLQTRAQVAVGPPPPLFRDEGRGAEAMASAAAPLAAGGAAAPPAAGGGFLGTLGKLATGDVGGIIKDQLQQQAADAIGLGGLNKAVTDFNGASRNPGAIPGVAGLFGVPQPPAAPAPGAVPGVVPPNTAGGLGGLAGGLANGLGGGGIPGLGGLFKGGAEKALQNMAQQKLANALGVGDLNAAIAGGKLEDPAVLAALLNGGNVSQGDLQAIALLRNPAATDAQRVQAMQLLLNGGGAPQPAASGLATPPQIADLAGAASPLAAYSMPGAEPSGARSAAPIAASPLAGYSIATTPGVLASAAGTGTPAQNAAAALPIPGDAGSTNSPGAVTIDRYTKPDSRPYASGNIACVQRKHPDYNQQQNENVARRLVPYAWELKLPPDPKGIDSVYVVSPRDLFGKSGRKPDLSAEFQWLIGEYWESPDRPNRGSVIRLSADGTGEFQYAAYYNDARDKTFRIQWFVVTDDCGVMMGGTHPSYQSELFQILLVTLDGQHDFSENRKWVADWVQLHGKPAAIQGFGKPRAVYMSRIQELTADRLPRTFPK